MTNTKKQLGQFFTTNSDYILDGLQNYIKGKNVTDPFAGSQDLMLWAKKHEAKKSLDLMLTKNILIVEKCLKTIV